MKNIKDNDFNDNKLTNINSITVNRDPSSENEETNKEHIDDSKREGTRVRFNKTLQNDLKVSVRIDTYNLTKYDRIQVTDATGTNFPNIGRDLIQNEKLNVLTIILIQKLQIL